MSGSAHSEARAFRILERRLTHRRLAQLDLRLRLELVALAVLVAGFVFWQARIPLDGLARHRGPIAVLSALGLVGLLLAALGAVLAGIRHAHRFRVGPGGPPWLALPVSLQALRRHLAHESSLHAAWVAVPGLGIAAAAFGLAPTEWLLGLIAAFAWLLVAAGRLGCALGERAALRSVEHHPTLPPLVQLLSTTGAGNHRSRVRSPRWRRLPAWLALADKDLRLTGRMGGLRRSALLPVLLGGASFIAWGLPGDLGLRHFAAFVLTLLAAAALAEWLVALSGSDPFASFRVLPLGLAPVWFGRFVWGFLGAVVLVLGHALVARELSPQALRVFLVWAAGAVLGIVVLGVNYGVTLFPRADIAQRLLGLSLALAVAASVMIPLSGWVVLLSAILHSARRLPHWSRLEEG